MTTFTSHHLVDVHQSRAQLGRLEEAIKCFNKAVSINPREKKAWYNKAVVLCIFNKYDEARRCLSKALEIDPNYGQAKSLLTLLNKSVKN